MKAEDLIIPGAILIGGFYILSKLGGKILPAIGGVAASGVTAAVGGAVDTGSKLVQGGTSLVEIPKNIVTQNTPALAKNTVGLLAGLKAVPFLGAMLDVPSVNTAMTGLSIAAKGKQEISTPKENIGLLVSTKASGRFTTPVKITQSSPIVYVQTTTMLKGLINPKTGFRYSGR
jgi:hypothetical protein